VRFKDRRDAGVELSARLRAYRDDPQVTVLGLPRGGVPVAYEVASALRAPLDVFVVRKLGVPGRRELAMGAIASGGVRVLNQEVIDNLRIPLAVVEEVAREEEREIERQRRLYRGDVPFPPVAGRTVILVDDGLATGSTMRAAVKALRTMEPGRIVAAAPVAAPETVGVLGKEADAVVALTIPDDFRAVSIWYEQFSQTSDQDVRELLESAASSYVAPVR
jgi:putative phosphoribosyl transferase